jgi:hypothetical protein
MKFKRFSRTSTCLIGGVLALAGCGSAIRSPADDATTTHGRAPVASRAPLAASYELFGGSGVAPAPSVVRQLKKLGRHTEETYRAMSPNGPIWATASEQGICILAGRPLAIGCEPLAKARTHGVTLGVVEHPGDSGPHSRRRFTLYGIVPDAQTTVRLQIGRTVRVISVVDDAYSLRSKEPVVKLP